MFVNTEMMYVRCVCNRILQHYSILLLNVFKKCGLVQNDTLQSLSHVRESVLRSVINCSVVDRAL